jgi:phage tail sheath gpL-like
MISFTQIPVDIRTPGQFLEFDASKAVSGLPAAPNKMLLIGQRLNTGTVAALVPTRIVAVDQATQAFGRGSMLDRMARFAKLNDAETEMWAVALDDLPAGVAATGGTITLGGTATASGILYLMIAGQSLKIPATVGETAAAIATRVGQTINVTPDLPVTANVAGAVVTLTARHKGTAGNDLDVRVNYYQGEALPLGITCAIVALSGGTGNPDLSTVWAAIGDAQQYRTVIIGFTDTATYAAAEAEMASRWGAMRQVEGVAYFGARGTQGALAAVGGARNSPFTSIIGAKAAPNPPYEWASAYGAKVGFASAIDPARPFQTLELAGILAPAPGDQFTRTERELLLRDGISTWTLAGGSVVQIERAISTYQVNAFNLEDVAWLDLNTPLTLAYLRYSVRVRIATKYPRHKLADNGTAFAPGQAVVTPNVLRAELIVLAREWEEAGLVENIDQFKALLMVERDETDRNRVNALIPPDIINQLRVFAGRVEYRL